MTDPVEAVIEFAAKYDIHMDKEDAELFVSNRSALAQDPSNAEFQKIARHFESVFALAKDDLSFEDFDRPSCPNDCPWCSARNRRYAAHVTKMFAAIPPRHIVEKCRPYLRKMWREDYQLVGTEGINGFMERTGLTATRIEEISGSELAAYA